MYFPYFRGKQYELITIRETATLFASARITPIISPVREQFRGLQKALSAVCDAKAKAILVVNPAHGQLNQDGSSIIAMLDSHFKTQENILIGIRLSSQVDAEAAQAMCKQAGNRPLALIHAGMKNAKEFARHLTKIPNISHHIYLDEECGKLYQRNFRTKGTEQILIRDGFQRRRNRDHPDVEYFSDLHITYEDEGMGGFGDYLIVGDEFSEGGGPAYTIAIHLTYIDPDQDSAMFVRHFLSHRQDTPKDPAGKFAEALTRLVEFLDGPSGAKVSETTAIKELRDLHKRQHYPGLGYVKKLSMKHHLETLASFMHGQRELIK